MRAELRKYAAVNARVRALLPGLLGRSGLESLYTYPTPAALSEVLARTPYGLGHAGEAVSAGDLPRRAVMVGRTILTLLNEPESGLIRTYIRHYEVDNLKVWIRRAYRQLPADSVRSLLIPLGDLATLDDRAMSEARTLRELGDGLAGTVYAAPFAAALQRTQEPEPFAVEVAVELDYYERLWAATERLAAADRSRAQHLLGILFDILNLNWIARYRDVFGLLPEEVGNYTLPHGRWLTPAARRQLAEGAGWTIVLAATPYGSAVADADERGFDIASARLWRFLAVEIQRNLRGEPFHIGVPLGLLLMQEIEIRDLSILLSAKQIRLSAEDARERLATVRQ